MPILESIYLQLPVSLQNLLCSVEGWRIQQTRFSSGFQQALREAESRTFLTRDQVQEYQNVRLQILIQHAAHTVPYYRRLFVDHGIDPKSIRTVEDLAQIPILTKTEVQNNYSDFISESIPKSKRILAHTSGTTGAGLRFATTRNAIDNLWAVWWRYRRWHGIDMDTLCGYFGGRSIVPLQQSNPPYWRINKPGNQILFSAYHINNDNIPSYIEALRKYQPIWLHGYPSVLSLIASYISESGEKLGYPIRHITIGAENLAPHQSALIEAVFEVKPIQHYGMAEAVANISECPNHHLHIDEDHSIVELLPNPNSNESKIIGTNYTNLATPLIRYDTQDVISINGQISCDCGRPGRLIKEIDGRFEDYIVLKNGMHLGRMDHIFKDLTNIREAQLYQDRPGAIEVRIVKAVNYKQSDETKLRNELIQRVGESTELSIVYVDRIERSQNGKIRFVISDIK